MCQLLTGTFDIQKSASSHLSKKQTYVLSTISRSTFLQTSDLLSWVPQQPKPLHQQNPSPPSVAKWNVWHEVLSTAEIHSWRNRGLLFESTFRSGSPRMKAIIDTQESNELSPPCVGRSTADTARTMFDVARLG